MDKNSYRKSFCIRERWFSGTLDVKIPNGPDIQTCTHVKPFSVVMVVVGSIKSSCNSCSSTLVFVQSQSNKSLLGKRARPRDRHSNSSLVFLAKQAVCIF